MGKQLHGCGHRWPKSMVVHHLLDSLPVRSVPSKYMVLVAYPFYFDGTFVCPYACFHDFLFPGYVLLCFVLSSYVVLSNQSIFGFL